MSEVESMREKTAHRGFLLHLILVVIALAILIAGLALFILTQIKTPQTTQTDNKSVTQEAFKYQTKILGYKDDRILIFDPDSGERIELNYPTNHQYYSYRLSPDKKRYSFMTTQLLSYQRKMTSELTSKSWI